MLRDSGGDARHYGSMYTMTDYESQVHSLFFNANFVATKDINIFASATYNKAEAGLEKVVMPDVSARLVNPNVAGGVDLTHFDFTFDEMHEYSNFDYTLLTVDFGLEYKITPTLKFSADGTYGDLTDDAGYVFGNESGSYFIIRTGLKVDF